MKVKKAGFVYANEKENHLAICQQNGSLKDDGFKFGLSLCSDHGDVSDICQKIWKTQQWPQDWKRAVFIPIPKRGNAKECSNYHTIALISHTSKVMLKSPSQASTVCEP